MSENKKFIAMDGKLIEVTQEVYEAYYRGLRKEKYYMHDLKVGRSKVDPITGEKILLPSREDSFERLLEVTQQFEDCYTNVEGEVIHKIEVKIFIKH